MNPAFERCVGIDYSGAQTPTSSLKGLRVYEADRLNAPQEVEPPPSPRKYWTRKGIAEWLVQRLSDGSPSLVGIDHGFSFPLRYFQQHGLPLDWPSFLDDFQRHWPTDEDVYVDFVRDGSRGIAAARSGSPRWRHSKPNLHHEHQLERVAALRGQSLCAAQLLKSSFLCRKALTLAKMHT